MLEERLLDLQTKYPPRPRGKRPPYGYILDEEQDLLQPDYDVLVVLDRALDFLDNGLSLREVTEWFNSDKPENAPPLTFIGMKGIWDRERPDHPTKKAKVPKSKQPKLTREEKLERRRRARVGADKRSLLATQKRIERLEAKPQEEVSTPFIVVPAEERVQEYESVPDEQEVYFRPNPGPQYEFLASSEQEVLYGGAAGGGKSYAMIADPMRYFDNPRFNGLLLRRTNDELRKLVMDSQLLYPKLFPKARWSEKKSAWTFPSGAQFWMTYLEQDKDVQRYQGQDFCWIGVDELTQYSTPEAWMYLSSRLRSPDPSLPLCMRATTNPGGPGHGWVKKMFVDPAPPGQAFPALDLDDQPMLIPEGDTDFPEHMWGKPLFYRKFIPAKLIDNPYLGWQYKKNLMTLRPELRDQLLEGNWDVADGAAFSEFKRDIHTCKPFEIPRSWRRFRSCDYGYASAAAVHWFAIDPSDETLYVYRELHVSLHTGEMLAKKVLELEADEDISYGVLDHQTFERKGQTGPSIAENMIRLGCRWRPTDNSTKSRANGKNRFHELLRVNPVTNKPGIIFFENCRKIITTLPIIPTHPDGKDDIDDRFRDDHAYDSVRYGIMSRPKSYSIWDAPSRRKETYRPADPIYGY